MKTVRWYFDFVSPYSYLQSAWLDRFGDRAAVEPVPILFAGLLNHWGTTGPAELGPKRVWTYRLCQWLADRNGIPFRAPPAHPFNPIRPLRLAIAAGAGIAPVRAIFRGIWGEGRDPGDPAEWPGFVAAAGIEGGADAAERRIADPKVKARLRANTEAAVEKGVFGVPTLEVDGELFWGVDGTEFALAFLDDPAILDTEEMRRLGALPVGVERRGAKSEGTKS